MTFLSHSIPWLSLSHLLEYHAARSRPGPQAADLYGKEGPTHRQQLEHFARTFQKTVREHGLVERARFSTVQAYRDRATTWIQSYVEGEQEPPGPGQNEPSSDTTHDRRDTSGSIENSAHVRNVASSSSSSSTTTEMRRVYPTHFSDTYMSLVPPTSGRAYGRRGLLASLADISTWIDHCARYRASRQGGASDEETRNAIWLDNKSCSDVLKLLLIDASTTNDEPQRKARLSTLLLLANHPRVGLADFMDDSMSCCNIVVGLSALVEKTTMVFILLNLLLALVGDDQGSKLLRPCASLEDHGPTRRHGQTSLTRLLPRPAYMNTRSFVKMLEQALDEHCHAVEHVLLNPIFAPRPSGRLSKWLRPDADPAPNYRIGREEEGEDARFERDVLADRKVLGEALKSMWKVLVFCDMVFREADASINWERVSLDAIAQLFPGKAGVDKLVGEEWESYEADREEEGGFKFYVNEDVNEDVDLGVDVNASVDGDDSE